MKKFNINTETVAASKYDFRGAQQQRAEIFNAVRVFRFRDIKGNVDSLPKYILASLREAGYTPHYLGGTTYSHSVIGLAVTTPDDERAALNKIYWCPQNLKFIRDRAKIAVALFPELKTEFFPKIIALELEATK